MIEPDETQGNSVAIFERASLMLAEADTLQKVKEFKNLALTAADLARRRGMGEKAVQYARSYALEAERKMGEMLRETPRAPAGRPKEIGIHPIPILEPTIEKPPTLAEIGVTKVESARAQMLADIPRETFEKVKEGKKTIVEVKRERKEQAREERRDVNREKVEQAPDPVSVGAKFATIVIDPPWDWGDEGDCDQLGRSRPTYATMSIGQIEALPVSTLADDDCHLYLWITNRSLPKGFRLIESWGFRYVTCLTWCKPSFGMGNYFRGSTEQILFAVKGSQPLKRHDAGTWFSANRGPNGHSSKPSEAYELIESCSPGPFLEMFSRSQRDGWTAWGAEV